MEFKCPGFDQRPSSLSSSNYSLFSDQMKYGIWSRGYVPEFFQQPVDIRDAIHREIEKEKIRIKIIGDEIERHCVLEAEGRRDLIFEREMTAGGFPSALMLAPPPPSYYMQSPEILHGELFVPENRRIVISPFSAKRYSGRYGGEITGLEAVPFYQRPPTPKVEEIYPCHPKDGKKGNLEINGLGNPYGATGSKRKPPPSPAGSGSTGLYIKSSKKKIKAEFSCVACEISATCERGLNEHMAGKKHLAKMQELLANKNGATGSKRKPPPPPAGSGSNGLCSNSLKKKIKEEFRCAVCKISATCERDLNEHMTGKKHLAKMQELLANKNGATLSTGLCSNSSTKKIKEEFSCAACKISATCERGLNEHMAGKKHLAKMQELLANKNGATGSKRKPPPPPAGSGSNGLCSNSLKKKIMEEFRCAVCKISATCERDLNEHMTGKKHVAKMQELLANKNGATLSTGLCSNSSTKKIKEEFSCAACKISATCERGLNEHMAGKKHQTKMQELLADKICATGSTGLWSNSPKKKIEEFSCAACKISATCERGLNEHMAGKKHQTKMQELLADKICANGSTGLWSNSPKKKIEEFSCAACKISAPCEHGLNEHMAGKKHLAKMQELLANKNGATGSKRKPPPPPAGSGSNRLCSNSLKKKIKEEFRCAVCKISATCERDLNEHMTGKKHLAKMQELLANKNGAILSTGLCSNSSTKKIKEEFSCAVCKISATCERGLNEHMAGKKHQTKMQELLANKKGATCSTGLCSNSSKKKIKEEFSCVVCKISATCERGLNEHMAGKKHHAKMQELLADKNGATLSTGLCSNNSTKKVKEDFSCVACKISAPCERGLNEHMAGKKHHAKMQELLADKNCATGSTGLWSNSPKKKIEEFRCAACKICAPCERGLNEHMAGKKHLAKMQELLANKNGATGSKRKPPPPPPAGSGSNGLCSNSLKKKIKEEFRCAVCKISATCERDLNEHMAGKKHMAKMQELLANKNGATGATGLCSNNSKKKTKEEFCCAACKISATFERGLNEHMAGKKHMSKMQERLANKNGSHVGPGKNHEF